MDLITDQEFLEAVVAFLQGLPMPDLWQDDKWRVEMEAMQGVGVEGGGQEYSGGHHPAVLAEQVRPGRRAGRAGGRMQAHAEAQLAVEEGAKGGSCRQRRTHSRWP